MRSNYNDDIEQKVLAIIDDIGTDPDRDLVFCIIRGGHIYFVEMKYAGDLE